MRPRSAKLFWLVLVAPAALALVSFSFGHISEKLSSIGMSIGLFDLLIGLISSGYCASWIGERFGKSVGLKAILVIVSFLGLCAVNFMMICMGCAANFVVRMH